MLSTCSRAPKTGCLLFAVLAVACDRGQEPGGPFVAPEEPGEVADPTPVVPTSPPITTENQPLTDEEQAEAELQAAEGEDIEGEVRFYATENGVRLVATVENVEPGKHGFHVHEKGDCSDIAGKSMGGHYNPEGHPHALPSETDERHLGDLGNLEVQPDGGGRLVITLDQANLKPNDPMSLLDKAVVVHEGEDAGKAKQPAGDSGTPIACGVIKKK